MGVPSTKSQSKITKWVLISLVALCTGIIVFVYYSDSEAPNDADFLYQFVKVKADDDRLKKLLNLASELNADDLWKAQSDTSLRAKLLKEYESLIVQLDVAIGNGEIVFFPCKDLSELHSITLSARLITDLYILRAEQSIENGQEAKAVEEWLRIYRFGHSLASANTNLTRYLASARTQNAVHSSLVRSLVQHECSAGEILNLNQQMPILHRDSGDLINAICSEYTLT